ncbi:MAG: hypothetical protein QOK49_2878, partial [Baekduia sp.]|nr:hypothetical protein [Baekduia sp.]
MILTPRRRGGARAGSAVAGAAGCVAALAVAAVPAVAQTTELRVFSLTAEGHGSYHRHDDLGGPA